MPSLESISLHRLEIPLKVPYKLAFGPVKHFDTVIARITDKDGNTGLGEATILTGYTEETIDQSWKFATAISQILISKSKSEIQTLLGSALSTNPFTVTALATAIEMATNTKLFSNHSETTIPILGVVNSEKIEDLEIEIENLLIKGFSTLKVKVGFEVNKDLLKVSNVQKVLKNRAKIRIDGNQGYSRSQAIHFIENLAPDGIELFEQPCHADDWDSALAIAKIAHVPMMLDESIYNCDDIKKAAKLNAATYIKVKLMKFGWLTELETALSLISELGMKPVLGNGVAGEVGCWMEALAAKKFITNSGEMNGYLKPISSILMNPLQFKNGGLLLEANYIPRIDLESLERFQVSSLEFH